MSLAPGLGFALRLLTVEVSSHSISKTVTYCIAYQNVGRSPTVQATHLITYATRRLNALHERKAARGTSETGDRDCAVHRGVHRSRTPHASLSASARGGDRRRACAPSSPPGAQPMQRPNAFDFRSQIIDIYDNQQSPVINA